MVALLLTSCLYFCFPGQGDQPFKNDPLRFFNLGSPHNQGAILMFVPLQIISAPSVIKPWSRWWDDGPGTNPLTKETTPNSPSSWTSRSGSYSAYGNYTYMCTFVLYIIFKPKTTIEFYQHSKNIYVLHYHNL